jgi:spermidine synthase
MWFNEISESDTRTSYEITNRVYEGTTSTGTQTLIGDSPAYGRILFLDGEVQSAEADEHIYHETLVHPVMSGAFHDHADPLRVLVIGGGEGATVREVLRWMNVGSVDWVDYDTALVELCKTHLRWAPSVYNDRRVTFYGADIKEVLPSLGTYHVIIIDLPDPDGTTGYLYSPSFWEDLQEHLVEGGRMVSHCGPVRPFGRIGEGYQRLMFVRPNGAFYHVSIPSFQGEWGFLMWGGLNDALPFEYVEKGAFVPLTLRAVDSEQIRRWAQPERAWKTALGAFIPDDKIPDAM